MFPEEAALFSAVLGAVGGGGGGGIGGTQTIDSFRHICTDPYDWIGLLVVWKLIWYIEWS